ncbi:MAG: RNB domain-containing ribonuclease [Planctomycetes bacterium]|nr:RNB domain-containing ribonuclease [Planctomycetota bacterium]
MSEKNTTDSHIIDKLRIFLTKNRKAKFNELVKYLKIQDREHFGSFLQSLEIQNIIIRYTDDTYRLAKPDTYVIGYFKTNQYNKIFVMPLNRKLSRIRISYDDMGDGKDGDLVLCEIKLQHKGWKETVYGKVLRIVKPRILHLVAIVNQARQSRVKVRCLAKNAPENIYLIGDFPPRLTEGTLLHIKLREKLDKQGRNVAEVVKVLGHIDSAKDEHFLIISEFNLRFEHSEEALLEAQKIAENFDEDDPKLLENQTDLRKLLTVTVDPDDAKDFDDAVSLEFDSNGNMILGVHIADVSHFIKPDSALDIECRRRGVTAYLPGATLHMLPDKIASNLCSLREGEAKLAKSVFLTYDRDGNVLHKTLVKSVIRNNKRMTYGQVLEILENRQTDFSKDVQTLVLNLRKLADILNHRRRESGAYELNIVRPEIEIDKNGLVTRVKPEKQDASHNLVEECMLAANVAVAEFLLEYNLPYICRSHPEPDPESIENFEKFLVELGFELPHGFSPKNVQNLLDSIADKPGGEAVHLALLKSMQRAIYEAEDNPHYALQFKHYTHFTSPIRRYPDTIVHQIIDAYLDAGGVFDSSINKIAMLPKEIQQKLELDMPQVALSSSENSRNAETAEMRLIELKIYRMLSKHLGEKLSCSVTGIVRNSLYCMLDNYHVEGMLMLDNPDIEMIDSDKFSMTITSLRNVRKVRIGDRLNVYIDRIDVPRKQLDLQLTDEEFENIFRSKPKVKRGKKPRKGKNYGKPKDGKSKTFGNNEKRKKRRPR